MRFMVAANRPILVVRAGGGKRRLQLAARSRHLATIASTGGGLGPTITQVVTATTKNKQRAIPINSTLVTTSVVSKTPDQRHRHQHRWWPSEVAASANRH